MIDPVLVFLASDYRQSLRRAILLTALFVSLAFGGLFVYQRPEPIKPEPTCELPAQGEVVVCSRLTSGEVSSSHVRK